MTERLCDNCNILSDNESRIIKDNYLSIALKQFSDDEIILIEDDSDVNKEYSNKLEDLCTVRDASSKQEKYVIDKIRKDRDSKIIIVKDRGYDSFELFKYTIDNKVSFVVRLDGNRHLLFKGKKRLISDVVSTRKGKIHTKLGAMSSF